jgi:hypothetical protein
MSLKPITDIDHVLTYVHDGAAAERFFSVLGFIVTPPSVIAAMGIVNRLVLFDDASPGTANFIELMAVGDVTKLPPRMATLLHGAEGIKSIVLATPDAVRAHAHLSSLGHVLDPPVHVRREWRLDDGTSVFPEFDVLLPVTAGLTFNACHYRTPELYRRPQWTKHPNGVTGLRAVMAVADDPVSVAATFGRVLGAAVSNEHGTLRIQGARVSLDLYTPTAFAARYGAAPDTGPHGAVLAGYRLMAPRLETLRQYARGAGIPVCETDDELFVPAHVAPGRVMAFSQPHH